MQPGWAWQKQRCETGWPPVLALDPWVQAARQQLGVQVRQGVVVVQLMKLGLLRQMGAEVMLVGVAQVAGVGLTVVGVGLTVVVVVVAAVEVAVAVAVYHPLLLWEKRDHHKGEMCKLPHPHVLAGEQR